MTQEESWREYTKVFTTYEPYINDQCYGHGYIADMQLTETKGEDGSWVSLEEACKVLEYTQEHKGKIVRAVHTFLHDLNKIYKPGWPSSVQKLVDKLLSIVDH
jgi:hypothetical protein